MDAYLCLTVLSQPGEAAAAFSARLSAFWTGMLRARPDDFEKVYAETTAFEEHGPGVLARQYLVEAVLADLLESELAREGFAFEPIDRDEAYSRYEATSPEWMQIEH